MGVASLTTVGRRREIVQSYPHYTRSESI